MNVKKTRSLRELGMETPLRGVSIPCFQIFLHPSDAAGKSAGKPSCQVTAL
ncbi:MAG: hypothetical protein IKE30_09235 [Clostridia bacterium]|nr:hypothetical protein [Clostridia bacterium]